MPLSGKSAARKSSTTRIFMQTAVAIAITGAGLFSSVSPAQAAPTNCNQYVTGSGGSTAYSYCGAGTGTYRAIAGCRASNGFQYYKYGAWRSPGGSVGSFAYCGTGVVYYNSTQKTN